MESAIGNSDENEDDGGSSKRRALGTHTILLVGEGFGEECDALFEGTRLRPRRVETVDEARSILATSADTIRGLVVCENGSPEACIEALALLRRTNNNLISAAVVHADHAETRRKALHLRARCFTYESGEEAVWRAVRYVVALGAKDPEERMAHVDGFSRFYGLTDTQGECIELISRGIPYSDLQEVIKVKSRTKQHHFRELRERVGAATREEAMLLVWNFRE